MIVAVALTLVCTRVTPPRPEAVVEVGAPVRSTPPSQHYVGFTMDYWNESQGNNPKPNPYPYPNHNPYPNLTRT